MWSWLAIGFAILAGIGAIFGTGYHYGATVERAALLEQRLAESNGAIDKLNAELEDRSGDVAQAQADMLAIQTDLSAIKQRTGGVGAQIRSAFDAAGLGVCVLDPESQRVRAISYDEARRHDRLRRRQRH